MFSKLIKFFTAHRIYIDYEYVHIVQKDKFTYPFINFMNENFNSETQCFIYIKSQDNNFKIPEEYNNVYIVNGIRDLKLNDHKIKKIFAHSMSHTTIKFLYKNRNLLKKCYWIIWGYDIYTSVPESKKANYVKNNVKVVITNFDESLYYKKYNKEKKVISLPFYPSVISKNLLDKAVKKDTSTISVQINNSADISTIEILNNLAKFKSEKIKIYTILSYGMTKYNEEIINTGKDIFDDKFIAITDYLSTEKFADHIKNVDILILNQNRQQGVGNIRCSLYLGNKIFIRKEISTFVGFKKNGYKLFDTNEIKNMDFKEFIFMNNDDRIINKNLIKSYFDNTDIKNSWNVFYND